MRIVLDTNVMLRALANSSSQSRVVLDACLRRAAPLLLSKALIDEYRDVLISEDVAARHPDITPKLVELVVRRLRYVADYYRDVSARFRFRRDPKDAMIIELAIMGNATHIVTFDKDMLSLPKGRTDDARRFRQRLHATQVLQPADFLAENPELIRNS